MSIALPLLFGLFTALAAGIAVYMYFKGKNSYNSDSSSDIQRYLQENASLKAELSEEKKRNGGLMIELQTEKSEKDRLSGEGKRIFVEITNLKKDYSTLSEERDTLRSQLTHFQAEEKRKTEDFNTRITKLDEAKVALEDEKIRIRKEDEYEKEQEKDNRDRMWAEHEVKVQSHLTELCRLPQYNFSSFDNKNLPE